MEKQVLLKNILLELSKLPEAYLEHWYGLIHTFRENLPTDETGAQPAEIDDFDWDELVEDVMKNRRQYNRQQSSRTNMLLNED